MLLSATQGSQLFICTISYLLQRWGPINTKLS